MPADASKLTKIATSMVAQNKGILATDGTSGSMGKRMVKLHTKSTDESRRALRELLLTTKNIQNYLSGVILNDEIIRQKVRGVPFADYVNSRGILTGIKVDKRAHKLANFPQERATDGLDGLRDRLKEYKAMGARFAKWRGVIYIGSGIPTQAAIDTNSHALARYAALAQEAGMVPIVEPEVMSDGNHGINRSALVTKRVLTSVFSQLKEHKVIVEGMILKINMILPGKNNSQKPSAAEVAKLTLDVLKKSVSVGVPGIVFLSGGQGAVEVTGRLNEINKLPNLPWELSFSFERALVDPALKIWKGKKKNVAMAQREFLKRVGLNSIAREGKYNEAMEGVL